MQVSMETEVEGAERLMEMPSFRSIYAGQEWPQLLLGRFHEVSDAGRPAEDGGGEEDFEFACVSDDSLDGFQPVTAGEIFCDGHIRAVYPFFGRTPQRQDRGHEGDGGSRVAKEPVDLCFSLREFMAGNREPPSSSAPVFSASWEPSDGMPAESFCVWEPRSVPASRKKNHSSVAASAASKKWRLRDLVARRSHSDGKERLVFVAAPGSAAAKAAGKKDKTKGQQPPAAAGEEKKGKGARRGGGKVAPAIDMVAAHRFYHIKGGATAAGEKRRSFLPYRKDLLGFFAIVNAAGCSLLRF